MAPGPTERGNFTAPRGTPASQHPDPTDPITKLPALSTLRHSTQSPAPRGIPPRQCPLAQWHPAGQPRAGLTGRLGVP
ncbi:unnamed protein product, partial [Lampetra fluviatilis]